MNDEMFEPCLFFKKESNYHIEIDGIFIEQDLTDVFRKLYNTHISFKQKNLSLLDSLVSVYSRETGYRVSFSTTEAVDLVGEYLGLLKTFGTKKLIDKKLRDTEKFNKFLERKINERLYDI